MNTLPVSNVVGHAAGSVLFTAVWEAAINLPAGSPSWQLIACGVIPPAVAALSLVLQALAEPAAPTRPAALPVQGRPGRQKALTR